jgi:hypothetical protein
MQEQPTFRSLFRDLLDGWDWCEDDMKYLDDVIEFARLDALRGSVSLAPVSQYERFLGRPLVPGDAGVVVG